MKNTWFPKGPWHLADWEEIVTCSGIEVRDADGNLVCDFDETDWDKDQCKILARAIVVLPEIISLLKDIREGSLDFKTINERIDTIITKMESK